VKHRSLEVKLYDIKPASYQLAFDDRFSNFWWICSCRRAIYSVFVVRLRWRQVKVQGCVFGDRNSHCGLGMLQESILKRWSCSSEDAKDASHKIVIARPHAKLYSTPCGIVVATVCLDVRPSLFAVVSKGLARHIVEFHSRQPCLNAITNFPRGHSRKNFDDNWIQYRTVTDRQTDIARVKIEEFQSSSPRTAARLTA